MTPIGLYNQIGNSVHDWSCGISCQVRICDHLALNRGCQFETAGYLRPLSVNYKDSQVKMKPVERRQFI